MLNDMKNPAMGRSRGIHFQTEGRAEAKALTLERTWHGGKTGRKSFWMWSGVRGKWEGKRSWSEAGARSNRAIYVCQLSENCYQSLEQNHFLENFPASCKPEGSYSNVSFT